MGDLGHLVQQEALDHLDQSVHMGLLVTLEQLDLLGGPAVRVYRASRETGVTWDYQERMAVLGLQV